MDSWWMAPAFPFWPSIPWWSVMIAMFMIGAAIGHLLKKFRGGRNV